MNKMDNQLHDKMSLKNCNRDKLRVLLRGRLSEEIPGKPECRPWTLTSDFCAKMLGRQYDHRIDFMHIGGNIFGNGRCQVLLDLNVGEINQPLQGIPIFHYRVGYKDGEL